MEDEYDLEVEIERQLAQEEEEMAEMQENIANQKLAQKTTKVINDSKLVVDLCLLEFKVDELQNYTRCSV